MRKNHRNNAFHAFASKENQCLAKRMRSNATVSSTEPLLKKKENVAVVLHATEDQNVMTSEESETMCGLWCIEMMLL